MAPRLFSSQSLLLGALALSLTLTVSGCPAHESAPTQAAPSPAVTPTAPVAEIGKSPLPEVPVGLPSPIVDSELEPEDNAALESLLDSDDMMAYMPSDLIHDGGVILYQTLALKDVIGDVRGTGAVISGTAIGDLKGLALRPPQDWRRVEGRRSDRELVLRRDTPTTPSILGRRAVVKVNYGVTGVLAFSNPENGKKELRPFVQRFDRTFRFQLSENRWQLAEFTPIHHESQGGRAGLSVTDVQVFKDKAKEPVTTVTTTDKFITPDEVPVFSPGDTLRLEVAVQKKKADAYVFAHMVGQTDRSRELLVDDGTGGDRQADDGIYTGTFVVPAVSGLKHFGIDVLDASVFQPGGVYRSSGLGLSFRVKSKP